MNGKEIREQMISARDEYINIIRAELLGPGSEFSVPDAEHELISSSPTSRYSVGILFPQGNLVRQDNDETVELSEEAEAVPSSEIESESNEDPSGERNRHEAIFDDTASENLDEEIGMATQYMPSSMGVTFLAQGCTDTIKCSVDFATYRNALVTDCIVPYVPDDPDSYTVPAELSHCLEYDKALHAFRLTSRVTVRQLREIFERDAIPETEFDMLRRVSYKLVDYLSIGYVRVPHHIPEVVVDFSNGDYADSEATRHLNGTNAKIVALRSKISGDLWSVTVMLVNDLEESPAKANKCIFQSRIEIATADNSFSFVESNASAKNEYMDDEERSLDLLYRHKKIYGSGLGTSVDWEINESGNGRIWNDFFPISEIPSMDFNLPANETMQDKELSMKYLSDLDDSDKNIKLNSMHNLVMLYKEWVDKLQIAASNLDEKYASAASKNITGCTKAYERMFAGIETLKQNATAYTAFLLANRAMFMQRIHIGKQNEMSKANANRYPGDEEISAMLHGLNYTTESDVNCRWRPFQIAFMLMDINSVVNDDSDDRKLVDLIWFPTGGGKTEAYLGMTAFTIFYRRLMNPSESAGTAVIMRYTLRLLAAQQFTRASTLICACESIRQDCERRRSKYKRYSLGKTPITIGLWIGGAHIPNRNEDAKKHLDKLNNVSNHYYVRSEKERHNKFQVLKCPWCGTEMVKDDRNGKLVGEWGYRMAGRHFYMHCPHEDCDFTKRLPIQIIDEELYETPPTLLFGTVDKFAMMPWDSRINTFFGNSEVKPPELIIQDELHLISGALGTIVGLYETAIDSMCERNGVYPKIIASTATIRRAKEQCSVLYNREVVQFPAPGLDAEDSFFARESKIDYEHGVYGRKYVGIMPSGKTKAMTEIRAMAALLQRIKIMDLPEEVKDKFWTLTVYFNSLKDLGKASTLVEDDVKDFIIRTANRLFTGRRLIISADELTSRVTTTELNETLDKLKKIEYSGENEAEKRYASNILLATNMISVGIDVARLNVMLMVGQPKLTSEYIQASSRVGRSFPGVAFVQYDATKSRDRSHYERFRSYHESFYRFVEPTGATPFSKPARERALHAVLTAIIRKECGLTHDKDAALFDKNYYADTITQITNFVLDRISGINDRTEGHAKDDIEEVRSEIEAFYQYWQTISEDCNTSNPAIPFYFGRRFMVTPPPDGVHRLLKQFNSSEKDPAKDTLTSMRNVDTSVFGSIIVWEA